MRIEKFYEIKEQFAQIQNILDAKVKMSLNEVKTYLDVYNDLFSRLAKEESATVFDSIEDEIHYYKNEKPTFVKYGIYLHKVYDCIKREPIGFEEDKKEHLRLQMKALHNFYKKNEEDYQYFKLQGIERDSKLFTSHSQKKHIFAVILATYMFEEYLYSEHDPRPLEEKLRDYSTFKWKGPIIDLVELMYALAYAGAIDYDSTEMNKLAKQFEEVFNVSLKNHYRTFTDIKNRKKPAKFLSMLITVLEFVVDEQNNELDNRKSREELMEKLKQLKGGLPPQ